MPNTETLLEELVYRTCPSHHLHSAHDDHNKLVVDAFTQLNKNNTECCRANCLLIKTSLRADVKARVYANCLLSALASYRQAKGVFEGCEGDDVET